MNLPTVSIVIPVFNSAWSIRDTLLSVLHQSVTDHEVILVDDGSTDGLAAVIEPFLKADTRLRLVKQQNGGLAAARNRGLAEARGTLVAFLDADDLWHPRFLDKTMSALEAVPGAPFAYTLMTRIDVENRIIPTPHWQHVPRHDFVGLVEVNSVGNGSASLFRRDAVLAVGGYDITLRDRSAQGAEDWKLSLTLAHRHKPVIVCEQLVGYRLVPGGMSRSRPDLQLRAINAVMDDIRRTFPDTPEKHLRNARTVMNGWILPSFFPPGLRGRILPMLWESYGRNPFWFLSRDVRAIHCQKLAAMKASFKPRQHLSELMENGERPFSFLNEAPKANR